MRATDHKRDVIVITFSSARLLRLVPLASLMLTACALNSPKQPGKSPNSPQWVQRESAIKAVTQYQTRGAFAFLTEQQKVYARFFWQQTGADKYRLLLTNPLGSTELELDAQPGQVILVDNKGKRYVSDNAEEMIEKLTGMSIPLQSLRQWMVGLPGDATDYTLDGQYQLDTINYTVNGKTWHVTYSGYNTKVTPSMPDNMELTNGDQRIKLKMDNWIIK